MSNAHAKSEQLEMIFPAPEPAHTPTADKAAYEAMYQQSIEKPEQFWAEQAGRLDWIKKWDTVKDTKFSKTDTHISWFEGAQLNVSANCIDRHLPARANQTAIIWEGDEPTDSKHITYQQLHDEVCKFANVLKDLQVKKGDVVTIYMPMIPEAAYAMLACTRIGAVHSVVFGGFSPEALGTRITNCNSTLVITADEGKRGGKRVPLKANTDAAIAQMNDVQTLTIRHTGADVAWNDERDNDYIELSKSASTDCAPEPMNAEDPLFVLYTSGSTGTPKGVLHTTAGYLLYTAMTHEYVFDYQDGDIYWCTADVGWVTGHSYIVYGPLANGATTLMFEGVPNYPTPSRFWDVVDKHKVTQFYTAPTAIRALMALGEEPVKRTSRSSLRILGSVGEPINPEAWQWYHEKIGERRCPIVDTWWQTETGGLMLTPLPYATNLKPGSATFPFFGVQPVIVNSETGEELHGECAGALCIKDSWPGQMRTVLGDHDRFIDTYFSQYDGYYFSGDGARRDADGYYWITGRMDDVLNVSGHRLGTAEIESSLVAHKLVAEAAVVGYPHDIKGQGIYVYVTLNTGIEWDQPLHDELIALVRSDIGAFAKPDHLHFTPDLPKTRSGKIMRRILRKIAENDFDSLGDTSTLLNPDIVDSLIASKRNEQ
jgi:acetyl-CoA synthetase